MSERKELLIHFVRMGPYHLARLKSAAAAMHDLGWRVRGLQICASDATYAWEDPTSPESLEAVGLPSDSIVTMFPKRHYESLSRREIQQKVSTTLDQLSPHAIAIAGWSFADARACLDWCQRHGRTAILMSETRAVDGTRQWWKEWIKSRRVRAFDAAIVGAASHADYLQSLGMPAGRIATGYNVVDNAFFRDAVGRVTGSGLEVQDARTGASAPTTHGRTVNGRTGASAQTAQGRTGNESRDDLGVGRPFLLASNRFIEIKNLHRAIDAFAAACEREDSEVWDLCLLGDGRLRQSLMDRARELGLDVVEGRPWNEDDRSAAEPVSRLSAGPGSDATQPGLAPKRLMQLSKDGETRATVFFPGFEQIEALPKYYARAAAFFHPAMSEPWGLVINEAMASGLPILASRNGGAAETLIVPGENGMLFDPSDVEDMAEAIGKFMKMPVEQQRRWGRRSHELLEERAPTSAFGEGLRQLLETDR